MQSKELSKALRQNLEKPSQIGTCSSLMKIIQNTAKHTVAILARIIVQVIPEGAESVT